MRFIKVWRERASLIIGLVCLSGFAAVEGRLDFANQGTAGPAVSINGTISGRVTDDLGVGISNIKVCIYALNAQYHNFMELRETVYTDPSGNYTVSVSSPWQYQVLFLGNGQNYISEWYDDQDQQFLAKVISVADGATVSGIDAQLATGGKISGRVADTLGMGIKNVHVEIYDLSADYPHGSRNWADTDQNGDYIVSGLPSGNWKVYFETGYPADVNYFAEWYNDKADAATADSVAVVARSVTPHIDAQLSAGGQITGRVTDVHGVGIKDAWVETNNRVVFTDSNGYYSIKRLRTSTVPWIKFSCPSQNYVSEYYNDKVRGIPDPVTVNEGVTTGPIDAQLAKGGTISGRVTDEAGAGIPSVFIGIQYHDWPAFANFSTYTQSDGTYVIGCLPAERYKVEFYSPPYKTEWYNDHCCFETADPIEVTAGGTISNIDAQLVKRPTIVLSKTSFAFGAVQNGLSTPADSTSISSPGTGPLNWTAVSAVDWLSVFPTSGVGSGVIWIRIARTNLSPGIYQGSVTISDPNAMNSPQIITVNYRVYVQGEGGPPFGSFDTPRDGATVQSSIAVTGWALDDIETTGVKIYRDPVGVEPAGSRIYIGDATFVEGARPDVELAFPSYPLSDRGGWGYMMLTNFLPNGGNGTFTIHAYATDREGHEVRLGSKTINCDNAHAVKPFGAIDLPAPGETISGAAYINGGWALTPPPNAIPTDGSTLMLWVDGLPIGRPSYNHYRSDIATLFPGYANSNGAVGVYTLDTTAFANGIHTIAWSVVDNAGNEDGIGSRYFSILNAGASSPQYELPGSGLNGASSPGSSFFKSSFATIGDLSVFRDVSKSPIYARTGYDRSRLPSAVIPAIEEGPLLVIRELERVEVLLDENAWAQDAERRNAERAGQLFAPPPTVGAKSGFGPCYEGYLIVGDELRPLPIGSTLDSSAGIFSWLPGPGFLGDYRFVFVDRGSRSHTFVTIKIGS